MSSRFHTNPGTIDRRLTRMASLVLLASLVGILAHCEKRDHEQGQKSRHFDDLNVVLITVDTLSARRIGSYNAEISTTPTFDKLARGGVLFTRPYSTTSWTQPAMASLFTSLSNERHGLEKFGRVLRPEVETLAEGLRAKGYATASVISSPLLTEQYGFGQGFDVVFQENKVGVFLSSDTITSPDVSDRSIKWLKENATTSSESNFFLFAHYFDPHWNYRNHRDLSIDVPYTGQITEDMGFSQLLNLLPDLTQRDADYLLSLHDEEIAFTDHHVGKLLAFLEDSKLIENTLIILTADHGEEFLEHGEIGHHQSLYEELILVPLIFYLPNILPAHSVDSPVSILDVVPTVFGLLGATESRAEWEGVSLVAALLDESPSEVARDIFASIAFDHPLDPLDLEGQVYKTALVNGDFKLIHDQPTDTWELFNLADDPFETTSLAESMPGRLDSMILKVRKFESRPTEGIANERESDLELSPDEIKELKSLGYVQ